MSEGGIRRGPRRGGEGGEDLCSGNCMRYVPVGWLTV